MREPVTPTTLVPQLERLNAVFSKYGAADMKQLTLGYLDALRDLDSEQVAGAVTAAIKLEPRFPVPAKLREYAKEWTARNRPALLPVPLANGEARPDVVCAVCGSKAREAWLEGVELKTQTPFQHKRFIAPCNPNQHPAGSGFVPFPPNFISWADA